MWLIVISRAALAQMGTDPACGWSEGDTAASQAVCGSSTWWRQVGVSPPHCCCRAAMCHDSPVVPVLQIAPILASRHLCLRWFCHEVFGVKTVLIWLLGLVPS